ncbi:prepilin peptidase [Shewanella sp. VB17]|uniref:prepilin peptidase n=1 Tax=Shewanella sp. VB17 TaxID=2739432 RepID=UPI0035C87FEF
MACSCIISFLQLCFYRIKSGFSLVDMLFKASHCEHCNSKIGALFLIPVFGFMLSEGSCQHCNKSISVKYFIAELCIFIISLYVCFQFIIKSSYFTI